MWIYAVLLACSMLLLAINVAYILSLSTKHRVDSDHSKAILQKYGLTTRKVVYGPYTVVTDSNLTQRYPDE
jgi:cephalosporin hydroxylase